MQPVGADGQPFSSTRIRNMISAGDVGSVVGLLGRQYNLEGVVVPGDQRGRKMGFPTANLKTEKIFCLLPVCMLLRSATGCRNMEGLLIWG